MSPSSPKPIRPLAAFVATPVQGASMPLPCTQVQPSDNQRLAVLQPYPRQIHHSPLVVRRSAAHEAQTMVSV